MGDDDTAAADWVPAGDGVPILVPTRGELADPGSWVADDDVETGAGD
jgi:hypothetical protein